MFFKINPSNGVPVYEQVSRQNHVRRCLGVSWGQVK